MVGQPRDQEFLHTAEWRGELRLWSQPMERGAQYPSLARITIPEGVSVPAHGEGDGSGAAGQAPSQLLA